MAEIKPTVISTFAGCGGSSLGYHLAGFQELLAVEWDDNAAATFKLNFPDVPLYHGDIAKLSVEECLARSGLRVGQLDVFDGSPPCFVAGTLITCQQSITPIEFITANMLILSHAGKYQRVLEIMERIYQGKLLTVELKYGRKPIVCTPEHPFFARKRMEGVRNCKGRKNGSIYKYYSDPAWIEAKDLKAGDVVCEPHTKDSVSLAVPKIVKKQRINIDGVSGSTQSGMQLIESDCRLDWSTNEYAWLLGFYLAEGHTRGCNPTLEKNGACRREAILSIADHEAVLIAEKIIGLGLHPQVQKHSKGSTRVTITDVDFWALCQTVGKGASEKFVPEAFHCMPIEWQKEFLDGYFSGDGCYSANGKNSTKRKATTVSWAIAQGISRMVARVFNLVSSIEVLYPAGMSEIEGRQVTVKEAYCVGYILPTSERIRPGFVDDIGAWIPVKAISESDSDGCSVYNFEVENDNSYVANGIAVHNCQGFSTAGNRKFSDPRNSLFKEYARLLTGLQPKVFVMENVTGMIKGCMKQAYLKIIAELRNCGYQAQGQVLNAMYYNVPQSRARVIIIGVRNDLGLQPSHPKPQTKPIGIETVCPHLKGLKINYCMYPGMVFDGVRPWHSTKEPAPTLSKSGNMAVLENGKLRKFTIKEAALLASFGKEFLFLKDGLQRIGNSVPPNLMKAIALHIKQEILAKAICNL